MSVKAVTFQNFSGGWATDQRLGIKNSFGYSQSLDFRKSPSQLSVLPGTTREDAGIVKDLILNEAMTPNGTIFAFGNAGYFYKRTTAGTWSAEGKLSSGAAGMDYRRDSDSLYLASAKTVSLYIPTQGTPVLYADKYGASYSTYNNSNNTGFNVSAFQSNSSQTTAIAVATTPLTEGSTSSRFFQSDIEPLSKVSIFVASKGTGNWTVTLHDGLNNVLATSTVTNANLVNGQFNDFSFSSATNGQVRIYVSPNARTYHLHVTSTVADGTAASLTVNDLSSCDLEVWADRLVQTNNGLHPMGRFLQYEVIGNANYLSTWEPLSDTPSNSEWKRHTLVFPMEYEVCGIAFTNEFAVIAAEQTTTSATQTPQMGQLFFWDGASSTYNYNVPIPEGSPYCLRTYKNVAYYYAGGAEWAIASPTTQPVKIRTLPGSDTEFSGTNSPVTIYPYAATVRRGIHLLGYPSTTTNTSVNFGVYSWGAIDKNYPETFGYNYVISTGSQNYSGSNNLQLGMVKSFGDTLHISWRDDLNGGYGIDVVDNVAKPATTSVWRSLLFDNGYVAKPKTGLYMEAYWTSLPSGATITLKYNIDQSGWVSSDAFSTSNLWESTANYARFLINGSDNQSGRFHEIQLEADIACDSTVTTSPVLTFIGLVFNDNRDEVLA